jgi:hypothetical protein
VACSGTALALAVGSEATISPFRQALLVTISEIQYCVRQEVAYRYLPKGPAKNRTRTRKVGNLPVSDVRVTCTPHPVDCPQVSCGNVVSFGTDTNHAVSRNESVSPNGSLLNQNTKTSFLFYYYKETGQDLFGV